MATSRDCGPRANRAWSVGRSGDRTHELLDERRRRGPGHRRFVELEGNDAANTCPEEKGQVLCVGASPIWKRFEHLADEFGDSDLNRLSERGGAGIAQP